MKVSEIMTTNPACCKPSTPIQQVARMMIEHDCGEIPVVDHNAIPIGVVTDRDICCRAVAECLDCQTTSVSEVMTTPVVTVTPEMSIDDCCRLMEQHMIRRIPVVDGNGRCCGIVSQADIAGKTDGSMVDELLKEISTPTQTSANV